ncbi:hypothetical protein KPN4_40 [Klebsiella phage KPN4]|uniref:Uncharacterized protein n=1 Tax=Klebsiella phage KPN4 TaxID=2601622 RepID=A0A5B9NFP3_9CAUD|nr:hypothetical protein KPN4_40 [Klebsiella phage KPN4]
MNKYQLLNLFQIYSEGATAIRDLHYAVPMDEAEDNGWLTKYDRGLLKMYRLSPNGLVAVNQILENSVCFAAQ